MLLNCGVGEDSWEALGLKEIQPVHYKGDQSWVFFRRNDAKVETPVLWPPHANCWLIGKDSDVGRDWGQEEKGMTEDEMARWHRWLDGRESEWTLGVGDGQGGLGVLQFMGSQSWTWLSDWTELNWITNLMELADCWRQFSLFLKNWLFYSIGLISVIHQHELATGVHISASHF